jgi:carbamoyltransferase
MKILGINEGHNCSACVIIDGVIVAAVSEERFTQKKNECGYPEQSIKFCMEHAKIKPSDLDMVAIASIELSPTDTFMKRSSTFGIGDYIKENHEYWKPVIVEGKKINYYKEIIKKHPEYDKSKELPYDFSFLENTEPDKWLEIFRKERLRNACSKLGVNEKKISFVDHHTCHAAYAYYAAPLRDDALVITADGWGDGANACYGEGNKSSFKIIKKTANNNLARLYRWGTLILGMKPNEHEYKVMGLAPYSKEYTSKKPYEIYASTLVVDGDDFKWNIKPTDMYFWFKDKLEGCRFDGIAAGLQKFTEVRMLEWVKNIHAKYPHKNLTFSGGLALNVKLSKRLSEMEEFKQVDVAPSGGDESTAVGAAYYSASLFCDQNKLDKAIIKPMDHAYLGPSFSNDDVKKAIEKKGIAKRFIVKEKVSNKEVAKYLAEGKVIARCCGRMEFGARALGNRSIMANPSDFEIVRIINEMIKNRDFWMPFTPSMLKERSDKYVVNPKKIPAKFMTMGFDSTDEGKRVLKAAIHPYDKTVRPQFVEKEFNPGYHEIISEFEKITGIGAILNTSLNLHGEPISCTPEDALHVFEDSGLDMLLLNDFLIIREK